jgi:uncharacterized membrane protein
MHTTIQKITKNTQHRIGIFFICFCAIFLIHPQILYAQEDIPSHIEEPTVAEQSFYRAKVIDVIDEKQIEEFGDTFIRQNLRVQITHGPFEGKDSIVTNEINIKHKERLAKENDILVIGESIIEGSLSYYVADVFRLKGIVLTFLAFLLCVFWSIRGKGVRALLGLVSSFIVIFAFLLPHILAGGSPLLIACISAVLIASISLYIAHGISLRTTIAFLGTVITIGISLVISYIVVSISALSGLGTEEAFFLQFAGTHSIDLKGILLAGIIIGTLGVLDDITTAQTAAVEQIYEANKTLSKKELYARGIIVGKEHIISLVNTLVLAYTGAALPLLLLFSIYTQPLWVTLNNEIIIEEIIRMLVGSMALIIAVPLTTSIAAYFFSPDATKLLRALSWCPLFQKTSDTHHHHHHGHHHS